MNNYELMENFLKTVKQFALDNPNKNLSPKFIYSLLIRYNIPELKERFDMITDKYPILYEHFKNNPNISLYEINNWNFLNFKNGKIKGNEIKLYIPYNSDHIVIAAEKIFDFIAARNIEHLSKISHYIRNDDFVIRVNTIEDANKIINFIQSDPFLSKNLLNVNPFLPNNKGIGMAMDNSLSFNFTLCEMIANLVYMLKTKNRLADLNVKTLNAYISECIPSMSDLDKKDIYRLLEKTTKKHFKINEFYEFANEKAKDVYDDSRKRITNPKFYLERAIKITAKYHPDYYIVEAINNYIRGNKANFVNENNAYASLVKYVPSNMVISLIRKYLIEQSIPFSNDKDAIEKYVQKIVNKSIKENNNEKMHYLEDAIIITEKYHPGFGVPALLDYINVGKYTGFTRKENARNNLINNVPPNLVIPLIKNYLNAKNIFYSKDEKAIEIYVNTILGKGISQKLDQSQCLEDAVVITEKYHPGYGVPALLNYIMMGKNTGFTRNENARDNLTNNVPPNLVMSLIKNYLKSRNIFYYNDQEAIKLYVKSIVKTNTENIDFNLDLFIDTLKRAYINTANMYNKGQANLALRHLLQDGDLLYFTDRFKDRVALQKLSSQYDLKDCIIKYLGQGYEYASIGEITAKMEEIFYEREFSRH